MDNFSPTENGNNFYLLLAFKPSLKKFAFDKNLKPRDIYFLIVAQILSERKKIFFSPKEVSALRAGYCLSAMYNSLDLLCKHNYIEIVRKGKKFKVPTLYHIPSKGKEILLQYNKLLCEISSTIKVRNNLDIDNEG